MPSFAENLDDPFFPLAQACDLARRTGNFSAALINHVSATMSTAPCVTSSGVDSGCRDDAAAMHLKLLAMGAILLCGVVGVSIPLAGGKRRLLRTDSGVFFFAKAFAAGVILATGFVHMLPDGQEALSDPCLPKLGKPWDDFPVAGFVAMMASLVTLVLDFLATQFYERKHRKEMEAAKPPFVGGAGGAVAVADADASSSADAATAALVGNNAAAKEEIRVVVQVPGLDAATPTTTNIIDADPASRTGGGGQGSRDPMHIVGMHAHAAAHRHSHAQGECDAHAHSRAHSHSHGHSHGGAHNDSDSDDEPLGGSDPSSSSSASIRHVVVSQILELGIVSHSVIIGLSLGVSRSPCTIRPLLGALSFHQFFEGLALGGCISQARFSATVAGAMACFFAATTPGGVALGAALAKWSYDPRSPRALVVEGVLDCVSAGILIYMALVDLIAADFLSKRMRCDTKLQISSYLALFLGALSMSTLAIWA